MNDERNITISAIIPRSFEKKIELKAKEYSISKSAIVRLCLKNGLDKL